jgi:hypothetical protein
MLEHPHQFNRVAVIIMRPVGGPPDETGCVRVGAAPGMLIAARAFASAIARAMSETGVGPAAGGAPGGSLDPGRCYIYVTRMLQECFNSDTRVTRVLQECYKGVTRVLQVI